MVLIHEEADAALAHESGGLKALPGRACRGKSWTYATTGERTAPVWADRLPAVGNPVISSTPGTDSVDQRSGVAATPAGT